MAYADQDNVAGKYGAAATLYSDAWQSEDGEIPHAVLEKEVVRRMLGACSGARILDIAGGSGNHARQAIAAGAAHIDVVDISAGMMAAGQALEEAAGRKGVIDYHLANAYKPLAAQVPEGAGVSAGSYDIVMANWAFDHVANLAELEALWANIAAYLKPGGRLAAIRVAHAQAESAREPVYGVRYHSFQPIKDGLSYAFTLYTNPAFTVEASSMETSYTGSTEYAEKAGITDITQFDFSDTETVKARPDFWQLLLKDSYWRAFTGRKR